MWYFQFSIILIEVGGEFKGQVHFVETPTWIGPVVPKLQQLSNSQNNKKQKKYISFSGYISKSMLPNSDWFRWIVTHIFFLELTNTRTVYQKDDLELIFTSIDYLIKLRSVNKANYIAECTLENEK